MSVVKTLVGTLAEVCARNYLDSRLGSCEATEVGYLCQARSLRQLVTCIVLFTKLVADESTKWL